MLTQMNGWMAIPWLWESNPCFYHGTYVQKLATPRISLLRDLLLFEISRTPRWPFYRAVLLRHLRHPIHFQYILASSALLLDPTCFSGTECTAKRRWKQWGLCRSAQPGRCEGHCSRDLGHCHSILPHVELKPPHTERPHPASPKPPQNSAGAENNRYANENLPFWATMIQNGTSSKSGWTPDFALDKLRPSKIPRFFCCGNPSPLVQPLPPQCHCSSSLRHLRGQMGPFWGVTTSSWSNFTLRSSTQPRVGWYSKLSKLGWLNRRHHFWVHWSWQWYWKAHA